MRELVEKGTKWEKSSANSPVFALNTALFGCQNAHVSRDRKITKYEWIETALEFVGYRNITNITQC